MFDPNSRYLKIQTASFFDRNGREIAHLRRRFLPHNEDLPVWAEMTVAQGDRLDLMTARAIGDPEQFWRICDGSNVMNPFRLTEEIGGRIRIPFPQPL